MDSLTENQNLLMKTVREGTLKALKDIFDPEDLQQRDGWFDYALLIESLIRNNKSIINYLLKNGCRAKIQTKTGIYMTPLCYVLEQNNFDVATKLLRKGASISDLDVNDKSPLYLAMEQKKDDILVLMLQLSDFETLNPNSQLDMEHFYIVCRVNYLHYIKKFIDRGFPVNAVSVSALPDCDGLTPLHFAVANKSLVTFSVLLELNADIFAIDSKGMTPLHLAFYNQVYNQGSSYVWVITKYYLLSEEEEIIKKLLNLHKLTYSNPVDERGISHFHISCTRNLPDVVKVFIDHGADVNNPVSSSCEKFPGYTPLHLAVYENCIDVIKLLVDNGANVNKTSQLNQTPLHLACHYGHLLVIEYLVNHGASLVVQDIKGCTPLHIAFYKVPKDNNLVNYLLEKVPKEYNSIDSQGLSHFHIACTTNKLDVVRQFINCNIAINYHLKSSDIKYSGYSALHFAVAFNRKEIVQLLLEHNADVHSSTINSKITPLHLACMHSWNKFFELVQTEKKFNEADWKKNREDQMEIIRILLHHGADVNALDSSQMTPLLYTCHLNIFYSFCRELNNEFSYDMTLKIQVALREELYTRCQEMINILLDHDVKLNAGSGHHGSILHVILKENIFGETLELIQQLLNRGVNINAVNEWSMSLLHIAVIQGQVEIVKMLLNYGIKVNARTNSLSTALHLAVSSFSPFSRIIIDMLLRSDCEVDARNAQGETPLHIAFSRKNVYAIKQLLIYGADINIEDKFGSPTLFSSFDRLNYRDQDWFEVQELIRDHVAMLTALGSYVSSKVMGHCETNLNEDFYEETQDLYIRCTQEIDRMKGIKVDSYSSLYNILLKNQYQMAKHTKNKDLKMILETDKFEEQFPLYGPMIKVKFHKGMIRQYFMEYSIDSLDFIVNSVLPESCLDNILGYLDNESLENLIQVKFEFSFPNCESCLSGNKSNNSVSCACTINLNKRQRIS